ncbi:alpha/beta hydrolase [Nocardia higoensis]|uniref:Alpha/beta hydrolase n=1 Tax=Nocardia higoensis TaxID=228599 RepID=A0ABS0DHN2_9NOCA|nr:alpha/beta hydrolase [Nocardia higoensis]MBF6357970.1 alpha/beta hydrolase [Nocardia higoensis]
MTLTPQPRHHPDGGRPSLQSAVATNLVRGLVRPVLRHVPITPPMLRAAALIDHAARLLPVQTAIDVETVRDGQVHCEIVRADGVAKGYERGSVLYFHGGGFVAGGFHTHRRLAAVLSERIGLPVVQVRYRYLPEATVPESVGDCLAAYRWLLAQGVAPESVVFAGDSAGGFLSLSTALGSAAAKLPAPGAVVAVSPWLDLDTAEKLAHRNVATEPFLPAAAFTRIAELGGHVDGRLDPALSPVNGDVATLPPTLLLACDDEFLRLDSEVMAARLAAAGVPHELHLWRGQIHAFPVVFPHLPESRQVTEVIARFVREHVRAAAATPAA